MQKLELFLIGNYSSGFCLSRDLTRKFNKMRLQQLISVYALCTVSFLTSAQIKNTPEDGKFQINGATELSLNEVKLLRYVDGKLLPLDSAKTDKGAFNFQGNIDAPEVYYLEFDSDFKLPVFIESSKINVRVEGFAADSCFVSGSHIHDEWLGKQNIIRNYDILLDTLRNQYYEAKSEGNDSLKEVLSNKYDALELDKEAAIDSIISINTKSDVSPYLVVKYKMYSGDPTKLEMYRNLFDSSILSSPYIALIDQRIEKLNLTKVGNQIPNFTLPDTTGKLISIEDLRGQYVLIDFWASWCGPCRRENPNIVSAYNKFQDRGFTVLGVSLDKERDSWLKAIKKDELEWTQLSDLKGWNNEVAELFGIRSIPFSILIDPQGIVVAKGLHGEDLHVELKKYLNK